MNTTGSIARSTQIVLAAVLVVGGLAGCTSSSKGSSPSTANLSTGSLQPSGGGNGGGSTGRGTTGGTPTHSAIVEPGPTDTGTSPPAPTSSPPTDVKPTVRVRTSANQLCHSGTVTVFADITALQHGITSVFVNLRFVPDGGGTDVSGRGGMTQSTLHRDTWSRSINGQQYGTGTLNYSVTATDSAGQSTTSPSYAMPVVNC